MRTAETKNFRVEIKEVQEDGTFEGMLSVYGNVDLGGDVVKRGAFTKTIKESGGEVPLLWQHDSKQPIGMLSLSDSEDALLVKGRILRDVTRGNEAYLLLKAGIIKGLSIGFEAIKKSVKEGVRFLEEIKLFEGSVVTFPMNTLAVVTSIKAVAGKKDFAAELAETQLFSMRWQFMEALSAALSDALMAQMKQEDVISEVTTSIEQFREAYLSFVPAYLDMMANMDEGGMMWMSAKAGRRNSATDVELINQAIKNLMALLVEEAAVEPSTSDPAAAAKGTEPDAVIDIHSWLESVKAKLQAA
jgi:hypothetical protein